MSVWVYTGRSRLSSIPNSRDCKCGSFIWLYCVYFLFDSTEFLWAQICSVQSQGVSINDSDKGAISRCSSFLVKTFVIQDELNYYFDRKDSKQNCHKLLHVVRHTNHQYRILFLRIENYRTNKYILKLPSINQRFFICIAVKDLLFSKTFWQELINQFKEIDL